jgi:hypothetical protein
LGPILREPPCGVNGCRTHPSPSTV